MKLLLLRHSIVQAGTKKRFAGKRDLPLTREGIALAQRVKKGLPDIQGLWVSPMHRCRQTAQLLFPDTEQRVCEDLRECDFGTFEGKTWEEVSAHPAYKAWRRGEEGTVFPGGDTLEEHMARCRRAFSSIVMQAEDEGLDLVSIVAHGGTVMAILSGFGAPARAYFDWLPQPCGGYFLVVEGQGNRLTCGVTETLSQGRASDILSPARPAEEG